MESETLRALLAGLIAGVAGALAHAAVLLVALVRSRAWLALGQSRRAPAPLAGVFLANLLVLLWTAVGLSLGAAFLRAEAARPDGALGSGNALFSVLVGGAIALVVGATAVVWGRPGWPVWASAGVALLAFGWLLPALAG